MNQDQIINLIQTLFKVGGGMLAAKGLGDSSLWEAVSGAVVAIATWYISHKWNAAPSDPQTKLPLNLIVVAFIGSMFLAGCSTPQRSAYQAAGATAVTVDAAMMEWGAYVKAAHPPVSQELAVKNAYEHYQAAMAVLCDAGAVYSATSQTNATAGSAALQTAVANASQSISDLENLITEFGVTLK